MFKCGGEKPVNIQRFSVYSDISVLEKNGARCYECHKKDYIVNDLNICNVSLACGRIQGRFF